MPDFRKRMILLKPMQPGVSGYARLENEGDRARVQVNARGLETGGIQVYWYGAGGEARLLGAVRVNAHGEAAVQAEAPAQFAAPERLQALLVLSAGEKPVPLMIGLCVQQSAGSLLDAKNAALALCDRLKRKPDTQSNPQKEQEPERSEPPHAPQREPPKVYPAPQPEAALAPRRERMQELPREIFLPAIDPLPYVEAAQRALKQEAEERAEAAGQDDPQPAPAERAAPRAPAADRLRPLVWPRSFEALKPFFERGTPCRLFDLPGWRFVNAAQAGGPEGLWLGMRQVDGRVRRVAYAQRGDRPPAGGGPYKPARGIDGCMYQVLWQSV